MHKAVSKKAGWTIVAFGDVVRQVKDRVDPEKSGLERYVAGEHMDTDDLTIRRWGEIGDGYLGPAFHMRFRSGHVLYGSRRTYLRKIAVADFDGITANTTYILESADPEVLLPDLLPFIMHTDAFTQHSVRESKGSVNPYVNFSDLAWFKFALPPIKEQRRIATILATAEAAYDAHMRLAEAALQVEGSYSAELLRPAIAAEIIELGEVAREEINKLEVSAAAKYRTAGVLNGGKGLFAKELLSGADTQYTHLIVLRQNQVVMRKLTAWEGAIAVVPSEFDGAVVSTEFPTITLDESRLLPEYMAWVIKQPSFWREMKARSKGTALRRSRLHQRDLLKIRLRVPSLDQQRQLVNQLNMIRGVSEAARNRATEVRELIKAIVEKAFGNVTVPAFTSTAKETS